MQSCIIDDVLGYEEYEVGLTFVNFTDKEDIEVKIFVVKYIDYDEYPFINDEIIE